MHLEPSCLGVESTENRGNNR